MSEAHEPRRDSGPDVPPDVDPLVGRVINDRFTIEAPVGAGGFGRVYRAIQAPLGRTVALKILSLGFPEAQDPNFVKRFDLEASVTARLTHPNTITIFDYGRTEDGIFYIAMEFLEGETLSKVLLRGQPVPPHRVSRIASQIARSLREAHQLGIIHRDLKPANVMLMTRGGEKDFVKVLDFGLVKFFADGGDIDLTSRGTFIGSPHYMAPEQARNDRPDPRADLYSLGVVMYQMATGNVPFAGDSSIEVVLQQINQPPKPPRMVNGRIPEPLEAIILKCMEKDRAKRFQSMDELLDALLRLDLSLEAPTDPPTSIPLSVDDLDRAAGRERLARLLRVGAAAVLGVVAAGGIWAAIVKPWHTGSASPVAATEPGTAPPAPPGDPGPLEPATGPAAFAAAEHVLTLTAAPAGEVFDGAVRLGTTPLEVRRPPGSDVHLVVKAPGFAPTRVDRTLEGESSRLHLVLQKAAAPRPATPDGYKEDPY